tara:strand:+ start:146 stop:745 length:600 start_codon:yes stop_codon:yes gene_type:complete
MGNVRSVSNGFELLGHDVEITNDKKRIEDSDAIVLPGVGAFNDGMKNLRDLGLIEVLNNEVLNKKKPYLGICLGLEFLAKESFEGGVHEGFCWVDGIIEKISVKDKSLKIPHMGWDDTKMINDSKLLDKLVDPSFYYLHSYYLKLDDSEKKFITSTCRYGETDIVASIEKDNIFAVQFHPEKSQDVGLKLLQNFTEKVM